MKKEELKNALDLVQETETFLDEVKEVLHVDIFEIPAIENIYRMFDLLINSHYTDVGQDWIFWWCYENDFGKAGLKAFDEYDKEICRNFDELYEYIKQYKC